VGYAYTTGDAVYHAFLYNGSAMIDLGTLGGSWGSTAYAINNSGQIVGESGITGDTEEHAFLYSGSTMYDLNTMIDSMSGWTLSWASDINNAGQIMG
jgi:probable HAF family extracellular repeat protein